MKSFGVRYSWHRGQLKRGKHYASKLQQDYNSLGPDGFVFRVLAVVTDPDEADRLERQHIAAELEPYNTLPGGEKMYVIPDEDRKQRKNHKVATPSQREYHTPEATRLKMSVTRTGQPYAIYSKNNVINDEQARSVKELLITGLSMKEVSKETGISYGTINNIVSNNTWKHIGVDGWDEYRANRVTKKRLTEEQALEIQNKYQAGRMIADLAAEYGKCCSTIQNIICHRTFA